jgi:hypothetical protein
MKLKNDFKFRNIIHKKEKLKIRNTKITLTSLHCIPKKFKKVYRNFYLKNTKIVRKYKSTFKKYKRYRGIFLINFTNKICNYYYSNFKLWKTKHDRRFFFFNKLLKNIRINNIYFYKKNIYKKEYLKKYFKLKTRRLKRISFKCTHKRVLKYLFKNKINKKTYNPRFIKKFKFKKESILISFFKLYYKFITKRQLLKSVKNSKSLSMFFKKFENRFDILLYRLNFSNSFYHSKWLIKNNFFCINNVVNNNYRSTVIKSDIISPNYFYQINVYDHLLNKLFFHKLLIKKLKSPLKKIKKTKKKFRKNKKRW